MSYKDKNKKLNHFARVSMTLFFWCAILIPALAFAAAPSVVSLEPFSGASQAGETVEFTTTFSDPASWQNTHYLHFFMHTRLFGAAGEKCVYAYYDQNTQRLYLRNDAYTAWLGGFLPGWPYSIENSFVKLDCQKTTVSGSGNTITVKWNFTFKPAFSGAKNIYLKVVNDAGEYSDWVQKGDFCIFRQPLSPP